MGYFNFKNGETALNETNLKLMQVELAKMIFPIGSTYITQTDTNPSTILEFGAWERVKGKVLVGLDEDDTDFDTIGKTGGEKEVKLEFDNYCTGVYGTDENYEKNDLSILWEPDTTASTYGLGSVYLNNKNTPHNNLQPYQVIGYMWIRTA